MGARQRAWAKRARLELKIRLGGVCEDCGLADLASLEFHHRVPRRWSQRHVEQSMRIRRLKEEIAAGEVGLLCGPCNKKRGEPPPPPEAPGGDPF